MVTIPMNKGRKGIILLFSLLMGIGMSTLLFAPLAFGQEAVAEEKEPVSEFFVMDESNVFTQFWIKLFSGWGETIASNTVGVLSAVIVLGIGYFVGRGVQYALRKFLKKLFSHKVLKEKGGVLEGETYEKAILYPPNGFFLCQSLILLFILFCFFHQL